MLIKGIPQFGIYNEDHYKLSDIKHISPDSKQIVYQLPHSDDGVYNIVLHGLLALEINEKRYFKIETATLFDAECLGLHIQPMMEIEQLIHLHGEHMCLSPNTGHLKLTNPDVHFKLRVTEGQNQWNFDIRLLSDVKLDLPIEKYAWIRLGKPAIDGIG